MKRNIGLKRGTKTLKRGVWKKKPSKLRIAGKSTSSALKRDIQALLRQIVMKRDGGCVLRKLRCGHEIGMEGVVFQADHLVTRANSASYADHRLVVCVCRNCHFWKKYHKEEYDHLVKSILGPGRVALWEATEESRWKPTHKGSYDWKIEKIALEQELIKLSK